MLKGRRAIEAKHKMEPSGRTIAFQALTPYSQALREEASSIVFPASDGKMGIMPGHAPLVAILSAGRLKVVTRESGNRYFFVSDGFVHVHEAGVTLLTEELIPAEKVDAEEAWAELQAAKQLPSMTDKEVNRREAAIHAAREKFAIAQEHRRRSAKS